MRKLVVLLALGFGLVVSAAEMDSWPHGLQSWEAVTDTKVDVVELEIGGGAGNQLTKKRAMRVTVPKGDWRVAAKSKATETLQTNTTLDFDILVPPDALPSGTGASAAVEVTIRGQTKGEAKPFRITKRLRLDTTAKDWKEYHLTWKYVDEESFSKAADSAQLIINTQSSGSAPWSVYVTNVKLSK